MLVKLYPFLQVFARRKEESAEIAERAKKREKQISHQEWIKADRIVMLVLIFGVIIAAIIFS